MVQPARFSVSALSVLLCISLIALTGCGSGKKGAGDASQRSSEGSKDAVDSTKAKQAKGLEVAGVRMWVSGDAQLQVNLSDAAQAVNLKIEAADFTGKASDGSTIPCEGFDDVVGNIVNYADAEKTKVKSIKEVGWSLDPKKIKYEADKKTGEWKAIQPPKSTLTIEADAQAVVKVSFRPVFGDKKVQSVFFRNKELPK
jgi:hypothetical protein